MKKVLSTIGKIGVSAFFLYFVFTKIAFEEVSANLKQINSFYLCLSGVFLLVSQWVSAIRLNLFFHSIDYNLSQKSNFILYLVGMFYNFFIPGGIGGDAYKVIVLKKKFEWKAKKLTGALFIDRFSGLTAIFSLLLILGYVSLSKYVETISDSLASISLLSGLVVVFIVSKIFVFKVFPSYKKVFEKTLFLSVLVQVLQLLTVTFLVLGYGAEQFIYEYLLVFLVSVVLSIISFAGIGVREYVFYQSAQWLHFDQQVSVTIGLLFTCLTAIISLGGIWYVFKKTPLEKEKIASDN